MSETASRERFWTPVCHCRYQFPEITKEWKKKRSASPVNMYRTDLGKEPYQSPTNNGFKVWFPSTRLFFWTLWDQFEQAKSKLKRGVSGFKFQDIHMMNTKYHQSIPAANFPSTTHPTDLLRSSTKLTLPEPLLPLVSKALGPDTTLFGQWGASRRPKNFILCTSSEE